MRSLVSNNRLRCLSRVAFIGIMAGVATGCSSDFTRFDRNLYAALPQSQNQQANNAYPANVDPMTTASVSSSRISSSPTPLTNVAQRAALPDHVANNSYNQQPVQKTYTNQQTSYAPTQSYNTGVVRQALPAATTSVQSAPVKNTLIDPIRTGSISNQPSTVAAPKPLAPTQVAAPVTTAANNSVGGWSGAGGTAIKLQSGETLYNISKRYGVPVKEIMKVNNIADASNVRAGQQILIPTYVYSQNAPVSAPDINPGTKAASAYRGNLGQADPNSVVVPTKRPQQVAALNTNNTQTTNTIVTPTAKPKPWTEDGTEQSIPDYSIVTGSVSGTGTYTVVSGDSLSKIASKYGTSTSSLMQVNGLQNSNIRIGQTLKIPGASQTKVASANNSVVGPKAPKGYTKPTVDKTVTNSVDTKAPASTGIDVLRWPVSGKVVTAFGANKNGQPNDGIDISVPEGTAVKAAENGVVIYSGSDLENFGNLVLIRHADGLVTAYAHNKSNSVAKNTQVTRGQVIAISGRTGSASTPILHFEVRKNSKPVNPMTYLGG